MIVHVLFKQRIQKFDTHKKKQKKKCNYALCTNTFYTGQKLEVYTVSCLMLFLKGPQNKGKPKHRSHIRKCKTVSIINCQYLFVVAYFLCFFFRMIPNFTPLSYSQVCLESTNPSKP